jgi:hypothetical protein
VPTPKCGTARVVELLYMEILKNYLRNILAQVPRRISDLSDKGVLRRFNNVMFFIRIYEIPVSALIRPDRCDAEGVISDNRTTPAFRKILGGDKIVSLEKK